MGGTAAPGQRRARISRWAAACVAACCAWPGAAAAAGLKPFGHACTLEPYGVRFCPTASLNERVPSWDGAPLDVDVTLPAHGAGPFPTIVMIHGYGQSKTAFETTDPSGGNHYTNVWLAKQGYAVVNLSVRGAGNSCGTPQSRVGYPACSDVYFTLGDQRYDARDVQWLLGLLVDEHVARPGALGVTGLSLGSLESLELALLYDRIRLPSGAFVPWRSPHGVPLHISAAYPTWAIASVVDLAWPSGRFVSFEPRTAVNDDDPIGVYKLSFPMLAAAVAPASVWTVPPAPEDFNLAASLVEWQLDEPSNPALQSDVAQLHEYHQSIGIPAGPQVAPILMEDGWDDTIVGGASQALRLVDYLREAAPRAKVALQLADVGHGISANKPADVQALNDQATAFFNHYLQGRPGGPQPGSITAYTSTCPQSAPSGGPYTAQGIDGLDPGAVRFSSAAPQAVLGGGDPTIGAVLDPVVGTGEQQAGTAPHCPTFNAINWPGTAVYAHKVTRTFTMLGLPTLRLHVAMAGDFGQLDARLWDVAPNGVESYVTRGTYALENNENDTITWQLWGGGYTFKKGDTIRVELLAQDAPIERPSLSPFTLTVSDFTIELPSFEPPDGGEIVQPVLARGSGASFNRSWRLSRRGGSGRAARCGRGRRGSRSRRSGCP